MPPRMFEDLVTSGRARRRRGTRGLPLSLVFHGVAVATAVVLPQLVTDLPPVAAAPPPPIPTWHAVPVVEVTPPPPPRPVTATRRAHMAPRVERAAPAAGTGPALPSDLSRLVGDTIDDDAPPLCLANCTGGGTGGAIPPGTTDGDEDGGGEPLVRRAGRDVTPPAKLSGEAPVYPDLAKRVRVQGDVVIECTIDPSGRVVDATVTRSIPLLDQAALDAVLGWRYRPTLVDGVPVPVLMTVTVRFRIR